MSPECRTPQAAARRGFTLVELLVVIGIIALLISVLLPALNRARRSAKTIKCSSNLRTLMQAVTIYAAENRGAIPGSPWTSGRFLFRNGDPTGQSGVDVSKWNNNNTPYLMHSMDWIAPIAKYAKISFDDGGTAASRKSRLLTYTTMPMLQCPENDLTMSYYGGVDMGTLPMLSYCAASGFLVRFSAKPNGGPDGYIQYGPSYFNPPQAYNNTVGKVGSPSRKIFLADGAKFSTAGTAPDYNNDVYGTTGGMFADVGAGSAYSRSWDRGTAPGNTSLDPEQGGAKTVDARMYAYRHGTSKRFAKADDFKANFAFFDGHVALLGDLESADPNMWYPRGTTFDKLSTELAGHLDTQKRYYGAYPSMDVPFTVQ